MEQGEAGAGSAALCTRGKEDWLFEAEISSKKQRSPPLLHNLLILILLHRLLQHVHSPCLFKLCVLLKSLPLYAICYTNYHG